MPTIRHPLADPTHPGRRPAIAAARAAALNEPDGAVEQVVLVDDDGRPIGVADKATVHGPTTPRHLAFSCYAFDAEGNLLVTQRAASKRTFPSVWTNTCCGHPGPGESPAAAAARRMQSELGLQVQQMRMVLPHFSYRASDGRVEENELCPVLVCVIDGEPTPAPDEVETTAWWSWSEFLAAAADPDSGLSPWARLQAPLLDETLFPER